MMAMMKANIAGLVRPSRRSLNCSALNCDPHIVTATFSDVYSLIEQIIPGANVTAINELADAIFLGIHGEEMTKTYAMMGDDKEHDMPTSDAGLVLHEAVTYLVKGQFGRMLEENDLLTFDMLKPGDKFTCVGVSISIKLQSIIFADNTNAPCDPYTAVGEATGILMRVKEKTSVQRAK